MCCHDEFPRWKTAYNLVAASTFLATAGLATLSLGLAWLGIFLGALLLGLGLAITTVCSRCAYFGRRCALGIGKLVPLLRRGARQQEFLETWPQRLGIACLVVALTVALAGAVRLCSAGSWSIPAVHVAALLAFVLPHPRWMCRRCLQREQGPCPVGNRLAGWARTP